MSDTETSSKPTLWDFSIEIYSKDDVELACLDLQDNYGVDINLLLYLLWRSQSGDMFASEDIAEIDDHVRPWRETVVENLRRVRRELKIINCKLDPEVVEDFRNSVKELEISSEALAQNILLSCTPEVRSTSSDVEHASRCNLSAYEAFLETEFSEKARNTILLALKVNR